MTPLAQKIYDANKKRYEQAANPLRSHGPDHHYRVYQQALELAEKLNVRYDEDIVAEFYTNGHLERKWESINSDIARSMARNDYEYSKAFFADLAQKLSTH